MTKLQKLRKTESKERAPSAVQQRIKRYQRELTGVWVSLLRQSHYVARRPLNFSPPTHNIQTEICLFRNVPYPFPHFLGFSFSLSKTPSFDGMWDVAMNYYGKDLPCKPKGLSLMSRTHTKCLVWQRVPATPAPWGALVSRPGLLRERLWEK